MKRRIVSFLMALSLFFILPFQALAESKLSISAAVDSGITKQEGLSELIGAFEVQLFALDDQVLMLKLMVGGNELISIEISADDQAFYLSSGLVNDKTYSLSWETIGSYLDSLLAKDQANVLSAANPTEGLKKRILNHSDQSAFQFSANIDTYFEKMDALNPEYGQWLREIYERAEVESNVFELDGMDAADTKRVIHFTSDDFNSFLELPYFRDTLSKSIRSSKPNATDDEINSEIDQTISKLSTMQIDEVITLFSANNEVVGLHVTGSVTANQNSEIVQTELNLSRLTNNDIQTYSFSSTFGVSNSDIQFKGEINTKDQAFVSGNIAMLAGGSELTLDINQEKNEDVQTILCDVYIRNNATNIIDVAASASPAFSLKIVNEKLKENVQYHLSKTNAIDPLQLTQKDFEQLGSVIQGNAIGLGLTLLTSLPESSLPFISSLLGF